MRGRRHAPDRPSRADTVKSAHRANLVRVPEYRQSGILYNIRAEPLSSTGVKALVTGSSGFIGSNLVRRLASRGDEVVGIDRRRVRGPAGLQVTMDLADRRNLAELARWARWADVVFHLAARPGIRSDSPRIDLLRQRDIIMTTDHLMAVVAERTHVILASSSSVYGEASRRNGAHRASRETDPTRPISRYGHFKASMERLALQYRRPGDGLAIARPFTVIGEGQRPDMALSIWMEAVRRGDPVEVFGGLDRARDVTDVSKVVEALMAMADRRFCGTVNLGAGRPRLLGEMVKAVFSAMGREAPVRVVRADPQEVRVTCADPTRARVDLGVDLTTDLERVTIRQAGARLVAA